MTAIILGWNPDRLGPGHLDPDRADTDRADVDGADLDGVTAGPAFLEPWQGRSYAAVVEEVAVRGMSVQPWAVPGGAPLGADAWLMFEGTTVRGLAGHGVVVSGNTVAGNNTVANRDTGQQLIAFDALLPLGDQVPAEVLSEAAAGFGAAPGFEAATGLERHNAGTRSLELAPGDEAIIRGLWARFGPGQGPDPIQPAPGTYPASAVTNVAVNRYERDPEARRACIAHRGVNCAVCSFSFEVAYGQIGKDFIDVHHVVPPARLGADYQLDPLTDLVPLCANCHAMAHYGVGSPRSVAELRQNIASAGYLRGTTVTAEALEAQRAAREILGLD
jgi:5-methylcytosine-specific restriction protein A